MLTKQNAIKLVKEFVLNCNQKNIFFNKIVLFGSYASGNATNHSDIDVLLVSDQFSDNSFENWRFLSPIIAKYYDIEPHPYPTSYFEKGDPFIDQIKKTGIEINLH